MPVDFVPAPAVSAPPLAVVAAPSAAAERPANMKDLEREHILATLREFAGSRKKTVEKLGISERTLRYKLQQYREEGYDV
jgi:two-component system response regulator FlrC